MAQSDVDAIKKQEGTEKEQQKDELLEIGSLNNPVSEVQSKPQVPTVNLEALNGQLPNEGRSNDQRSEQDEQFL